MPFYAFSQTSSDGRMVQNEHLASHVIVEADNVKEACNRAQQLGIYFDGVDRDIDCECCGDRWERPASPEGDEQPSIGGRLLRATDDVIVHLLDGRAMRSATTTEETDHE